jgi:hypothetical protein
MALGLGYTINVPAAAATNTAWTIWNYSCAAGVAMALQRIQIQSNQTGSTQSIIPLQLGIYATTNSSTGTIAAPTSSPTVRLNTRALGGTTYGQTATMGTGAFTVIQNWQWNGATPFDIVNGKDIIIPEFPGSVAQLLALIIPSASGTPTVGGSVQIEEL